MSLIEDSIKKYAAGDDAYALKLKQGIRDTMGYQNYMSRLGDETARTAPIGSVKGLSPAGINARISTRFGMQDENIRTLQSNAGAIDTAAGQIAASQISAGKKAAADRENLQFKPTNWAESEIVNYIKTAPKNEDGSTMTRQQLADKLKAQFIGEGSGVNEAGGVTEALIDQRIAEWVPADYEENASRYKYMAMGYTKAQAEDLKQFDRYTNGEMSEQEKQAFSLTNPGWANKAEMMKASAGITDDLGVVKDPETGEIHMKVSYDELKSKYPNMDETTLKELVKPTAKISMQDDIQKNLNVNVIPEEVVKGDVSSYVDFMESEDYKKQEKILKLQYGKMFTAQELETIIFETIMNGL